MAWGEPLKMDYTSSVGKAYSSGGTGTTSNISYGSSGGKKATLPEGWRDMDEAGLQGLVDWSTKAAAAGYDVSSILPQLTQQIENLKTGKREDEVRSYYDQIIKMYEPGGTFGQGTETMLGREKKKQMASGMQALVSSGLANTTQAAGLGKKFEEEVAMPTRLKLEDLRAQNYASAIGQKAGMVSDIQQDPLDYALLAQLIQTGSSM